MDTIRTTPLLIKLISIQRGANLSDYKFADKLGVNRIVWFTTRTKRRNISLTILRAIISNYPELIPEVIEFLRNNHEQS